ncbi:MAG TPA: tetratricopeptide repeat protein [Thermoanaerobaculia bacterium]
MAQPATNPKIEELRFRLKTDPKSRLFYPLAEELRKAGQTAEAEQVLRGGLESHASYLSAWVSLGRVLREQKKDGEAVDALSKALQLDPGNVVAARLLADAYLSLGDKVEAIKKYKLVHALMPGDEELEAMIATLDSELHPVEALGGAPPPPAAPFEAEVSAPDVSAAEGGGAPLSGDAVASNEESPFDRTMPPFSMDEEQATGDAEPMALAHDESPFEEPVSEYTAAAVEIEAPEGIHIEDAPVVAEVAAPVVVEEEATPAEEADVFEPAEPPLVVQQPSSAPKIARLETWLSKVAKKEVGRV